MVRIAAAVMVGLTAAVGGAAAALAYEASGDRVFAATVVLPQIGPGDEFYINASTLPLGAAAGGTRSSNITATYTKTITDNFGISIEETWSAIGQAGAGTNYGWQNLDGELKYLALNNIDHEFLIGLGLDRETGGTGAVRVGAAPAGATTPRVYLGKGLGDLDIGYLRPLAIEALAGVQFADAAPRPDRVQAGFVIEYSIPYLQSKVQSLDLPDFLRQMTPIAEVAFTMPAGRSFGSRTTALIAPGASYAGAGWELAVEALVPASRATGNGIGVTAQLHLALDYLFAGTPAGRPLLASP